MENKFYLGIDVSKKKLDCSIFVDNININQFPHFTVTNDKEGYKNMLDTLKAMGYNPKETLFGLEFCGCYSDDLEQFFTKKKLSYTMLPTNVLKNYPRGTRDKNDKLDSAKLADYICRYDGTEAYKLRKLPPENLQKLKKLKSWRKYLVLQRTDWLNRLQECNSKEEEHICERYIKSLTKDIEKVEQEQLDIISEDEAIYTTYCHLRTIPGIGHVNAVNVIVITQNFIAFGTTRQLARYIGVAPSSHTSGTSVHWRSRPSWHCDLQAKADLTRAARNAVVNDPEMRIFYERKMGGKVNKQNKDRDKERKALNAVMFKQVQRMFAIGKQARDWKPLNTLAPAMPVQLS